MPCRTCAATSKTYRRSSCRKDSDGTDGLIGGVHPGRIPSGRDQTIHTSLTTDQVETFGRCYLETIQR
jgi:hypothetical protein